MLRLRTRWNWLLGFALVAGGWGTGAVGQLQVVEEEEQAVRQAVDRVAPSVVRIETFGGLEQVQGMLVGTGPTTGLIVSEDGYLLSSAFNFVQQPSSILVTLANGDRRAARIVARDRSRMLVLLKVDAPEKLPVPTAVPRSELAVGQWSIAVGRTLAKDRPNVSLGVISALNRIWGKAIQTDAKISPNNYGGPLVDLHGRVMGILVPLSPQAQEEVAGAEWYDSGIGFAIPLDEVLAHLEALAAGQDLHPGLLGISLKGTDLYADPAVIAASQPKSPAYQAGLKAGDRIVEINGLPIERQAQLKHALGPHYAGDTIRLVAVRKVNDVEQRIEATLQLTDKLEPYENPFLGILPRRGLANDQPGIAVRFVYPGSPAAEAGIVAGDRLLAIGERAVNNVAAGQEALAALEPGDAVTLSFVHDNEPRTAELKLAALPQDVPSELPPAHEVLAPDGAARPLTGIVEVKIPEEANKCFALVPDNYDPRLPAGLVVWLHAPGKFVQQELVDRWKAICEQHDLILLAPQSADPNQWVPTEVDFVRKTIDDVRKNYNIDGTRIVVHGQEAGGAVAYLVGFNHRDLVRGIAPVDAGLPGRVVIPANDPVERLAIFSFSGQKSPIAKNVQAGAEQLRTLKYSLILREFEGPPRELSVDERTELVRWIDTLDRL